MEMIKINKVKNTGKIYIYIYI